MANRFGLSRHIPEAVALEVRRRSKFGCVVCRSAIYQYEHIDPAYADAKSHNPEAICLLCGGCHDKVTRGRLSKETVNSHYLSVQGSNDIRRPFEFLDLSTHNILVEMGTAEFVYAKQLIRVNGRSLLSISPPQDGAAFPTLNGIFCDRAGDAILCITDNVWECPVDAWDIRVVGRDVTVKSKGGHTALAFRIAPPNRITITHLDMYLDNCRIACSERGILVAYAHDEYVTSIGIGRFACHGASIGVDVESRGAAPPIFRGINIVGGKGVFVEGTGIRIGVDAESMTIRDLSVWTQ